MKKIIGIGNSLVDLLAKIDNDALLEELGLPKGSMQFTDSEQQKKVDAALLSLHATAAAGGSAANTMKTVAMLGMESAFIGKIGDDEMGRRFSIALEEQNVKPLLKIMNEMSSGIAATFISPDGQRTFADNLGASAYLSASDFTADTLRPYDTLYVEGYLVSSHELITSVFSTAKSLGMTTCLDLASYNVVSEEREFFYDVIQKYVDIVFANEEESAALTQKAPEEAAVELANMCKIAVVKLGGKGSCVYFDNEIHKVPGSGVTNVVDTTGAGDSFAGGFLYALSQGKDLETCLETGTIVAGEVIQHIGATLSADVWEGIRKKITL